MAYQFLHQNLYGYDVYHFNTPHQRVNVYFLHNVGDTYRTIVWAEDGRNLINPHHIDFQKAVYDIIDHYDDNRGFTYESFAE